MDRTVETERLLLRVPVAADLAAVAALWKDPELVKFIGRRPLSREQAKGKLRRASAYDVRG
jgi:RimJ/RimL family protein N-acetyltransferase